MHIRSLTIKNFRCFDSFSIDFKEPVVLITGHNGSGKSSLLEAMHYCCYLRSFRTHLPRELIALDKDNFFIKVLLQTNNVMPMEYAIQVGFSGKKRSVKIDQRLIQSYKELTALYQVITLAEDDLQLIKGSPEHRRLFVDQALCMHDNTYLIALRRYKNIVDHRNALLARGSYNNDAYITWTQQLWQAAKSIGQYRIDFLQDIANRVNNLIMQWFADEHLQISFTYKPKQQLHDSFDVFLEHLEQVKSMELRIGRSLFGAHLDDVFIEFCHKSSRIYASRGQQKLILVLMKVAQAQTLLAAGRTTVLLLDDFMADFDVKKGGTLMNILMSLESQIILTAPTPEVYIDQSLFKQGFQHIALQTGNLLAK